MSHPHYKHIGPKVTVSKQLDVHEAISLGAASEPDGIDGRATFYYDDSLKEVVVKTGSNHKTYISGSNQKKVFEAKTAHFTLTADGAQSNGIILLDRAGGLEVGLHTESSLNGTQYTFLVATAPTDGDYTIKTEGGANVIFGNILSGEDGEADKSTDTSGNGKHTITLAQNKAKAGDRVDAIFAGDKWYVTCFAQVHDAITFNS
jgi:hypothetical protein